VLRGGAGNDTLIGGFGNDTLTGGLGSDDFRINTINQTGNLITDFDHAEGDQLVLNGGDGISEFQWGYQSAGATKANTIGTITSDFLIAGSIPALNSSISNVINNLFGNTIASGVSSKAYFWALTATSGGFFNVVANQHTELGSVTTTFSTISVAVLEGITGLGTGINQIAVSDIILF